MIEQIRFFFNFLSTEIPLGGTKAHKQMPAKESQLKPIKVMLKQGIFDAICVIVGEPSFAGKRKHGGYPKGLNREDIILKLCGLAGFQLEVINGEYKLVS